MIAVIGDVHGCFFTLKSLTEQIRSRYNSIEIYCVGDLVDRGNFSFEVMEFVSEQNITFTPGNHDFMFYYHLKEPSNPIGKPWIHNGCEPTLKSYQGRWEKINDHLEMIISAPLLINHDECFISHAGISQFYSSDLPEDVLSDVPKLENMMRDNLDSLHGIIWNRDELINLGKLQVVGHTRLFEIRKNEHNNTLYIDTAAVAGNKLSAAIIEDNKVVEFIYEKTNEMDVVKTNF
jgi:serine/threonine protein phosphatase 1